MKLKFKKINPFATIPVYQTEGAAAFDIHALEDTLVRKDGVTLVHTGLAVEIPDGYVGLLVPRSGASMRTALRQPNCVGVIDSDYRGEFCGMFEIRGGDGDWMIKRGERFAQMMIVPVAHCEIEEVNELSDTSRGTGGFGSTGTGVA